MEMTRSRVITAAVFLAFLLVACGTGPGQEPVSAPAPASPPVPAVSPATVATGPWSVLEAPVTHTVVADSILDDPKVEALVAPFRERMGSRIQEVVGEAAGPLSKGWPEGTLGVFAADALLWVARNRVSETVDMALMNNGGLRVPIAQGPITVGKMFELMPFENMVAVLVLSGDQVEDLAAVIAGRGGEPIAGFSFRIELVGGQRVAREIRVGDEPVDPSRRYRLVTNDYLANGGDDFAILLDAQEREDLPLLVRDAFMEYLRAIQTIEPRLEGRITGELRR
jgi:2',3'-cyclic-nucleotide 2'-phosphodiesterase (5'-nucleotidase family)